jgi:uracil-DNA glycosylase family 4
MLKTNCEHCKLNKIKQRDTETMLGADVMWVGLSAKLARGKGVISPLCIESNTGKIVSNIESELFGHTFYKTNAVKCPPLGDNNKLRYPTKLELEVCFSNLEYEISIVRPKVIILLGEKTSSFFYDKMNIIKTDNEIPYKYIPNYINGTAVISVEHPSFIRIYRYKERHNYEKGIVRSIKKLLNSYESSNSINKIMDATTVNNRHSDKYEYCQM